MKINTHNSSMEFKNRENSFGNDEIGGMKITVDNRYIFLFYRVRKDDERIVRLFSLVKKR